MRARLVQWCLPSIALVVAGGWGLFNWPVEAFAFAAAALPRASAPQAQPPQLFTLQCAGCHGDQGLGTSKAPALAMNQRVAEQSSEQLVTYLQHGNPAAGMPSFADLAAG